jgi:hypothetical protein
MSTVQTQAANPSDKNAQVEMEFNIDDLLSELRAAICHVYDKNTTADKQPKQTLDLLTVTFNTTLSVIFLFIGNRMRDRRLHEVP